MADKFIGLNFGVAGGSTGASATQIKKELETIVNSFQLQVKVVLDTETFKASLQQAVKVANAELSKIGKGISSALGLSGSAGSGSSKRNVASTTSSTIAEITQETQAMSKQEQAALELKDKLAQITDAKIKLYETNPKNVKAYEKETKALQALEKELEDLRTKYANLQFTMTGADGSQKVGGVNDYIDNINAVIASSDDGIRAADAQKTALEKLNTDYVRYQANAMTIRQRFSHVIEYNPEAASLINGLETLAKTELDTSNFATAQTQVTKLRDETNKVTKSLAALDTRTKGLGRSIAEAFDSRIINLFAFALAGVVTAAIGQVYTNVVALDSAVTDLQVATGKTREETQELVKSYADLAQQLGATITEVAEGADTWLRQGYSAEEAGYLIENSMMLAKLGQMEAADASTALTSALKGYRLEVEDASSVIDKFTAVDMVAAMSAGGIATAMAETAAGADLAGVSMDRLIGYIATVGEVSQDAPESVGTFFRTIFARMTNVAAGKLIDPESGEALNDVEQTLKNVGIATRDASGSFVSMQLVLDQLGEKWSTLKNEQQHQIATAVAGTRQQEKFIILMQNYANALEYAGVAADSLGTAQEKFNEAYLDSVEAAVNRLTAAWQEFSMVLLDSDFIKDLLGIITSFVNALTGIVENINVLNIALPLLGGLITEVLVNKIATAIKSVDKVAFGWRSVALIITTIIAILENLDAGWGKAVAGVIGGISAIGAAAVLVIKTITGALNKIPIMAVVSLLIGGIMAVVDAFANWKSAAELAAEAAKEAYEAAKETTQEEIDETEDLVELMEEYKTIREEISESEKMSEEQRQRILEIQGAITQIVGEEAENLDLIGDSLDENLKKMREMAKLQAQEQYKAAIGEYGAAKNQYENAYESSKAEINGISGITPNFDLVLDTGGDAEPFTDEIARLIAKILNDYGLVVDGDLNMTDSGRLNMFGLGDVWWGLDLDEEAMEPEKMVSILDEFLDEMIKKGYATASPVLYNRFLEWRDAWQKYIDDLESSSETLIDSIVGVIGFGSNIDDIESQEEYDEVFQMIYDKVMEDENVLDMIAAETADAEDVKQSVIDWLGKFYDLSFDESGEVSLDDLRVNFKTFEDEVRDEFNSLESALESFYENGVVAAERFAEIVDQFPELEKYFKRTEGGYVLADALGDVYEGFDDMDILKDWGASFLKPYQEAVEAATEGTEEWEIATENLAEAEAYLNTLLKEHEGTEEAEEAKAWVEILNEAGDAFDMLQSALESFHDGGVVAADTMNELLEKFPELEKYFRLTEDGYIPAIGPDDAYPDFSDLDLLYDWGASFLQPYVNAVAACTEGTEEWELATEQLAEAKAYLATLIRPKEIEEEQEVLEAEIDALEEQLEKYREIIDDRQELLETYKEEIDYQKELADKQENVSKLRTQLAVAQLDTSAYGQARARELEEELKEAEEELNDFTLEHAIDVLTKQMDAGLEDYESFIEGQVDRIEKAIENLKFTVNPNPVVPEPEPIPEPEPEPEPEPIPEPEPEPEPIPEPEPKPEPEPEPKPEPEPVPEPEPDVSKTPWTSYQDAADDGFANIMTASEWVRRKPYGTESYQEYLRLMYEHYILKKPLPSGNSYVGGGYGGGGGGRYHTGGFVGGVASLRSNEEFAKLLKGEFVSTPAQMDRFINETMPNVVAQTAGKGGAVYNAPLVSIECGSITKETLPEVEAAIKAAVSDVKRQIDSAFSRTGYRRSVNKFAK